MNVVMLLYRTDLPYGVKTHPWHVRPNRLAKPLEQLQLLLLPEHHVASGHTLKLKNEFGLLTPKLLLDLAHKKLMWCTERTGRVIDFWVTFSEVVIIVRRLIREG
jgi:hypothetical protein